MTTQTTLYPNETAEYRAARDRLLEGRGGSPLSLANKADWYEEAARASQATR